MKSMNDQRPANQARQFRFLPILLLLAFAGCKGESKETPAPTPSAEPSATAPAPSATASGDPSSAASGSSSSDGDQAQVGDEYADNDPSALTDFHGALDPHGSWVDDGKYGTVWVPAPAVVGADFVPYRTGGHWVYGSDYTWVSDYDWGWAPFHYGRWVSIDGHGWGWIPGRRYAPAWVTWRVGAPGFAYVGWAPATPEWGWRAGVVVNFGFPVVPRFSYCGAVDLFAPRLAARVVVGGRVAEAEAGTRVWAEGEARGGRVAGPPPARCGIPADHVARPAPHDPAIEHAQNFGKPATAVSLGAHPPTRTAAPSGGATVHGTAGPTHEHTEHAAEPALTNRPGGGALPSENGGGKPPSENGGGKAPPPNKGGRPPNEPKHH
jgi:hypothetical protein